MPRRPGARADMKTSMQRCYDEPDGGEMGDGMSMDGGDMWIRMATGRRRRCGRGGRRRLRRVDGGGHGGGHGGGGGSLVVVGHGVRVHGLVGETELLEEDGGRVPLLRERGSP
jgi:hypothetical protein